MYYADNVATLCQQNATITTAHEISWAHLE